MKIAIASDHAAWILKENLRKYLQEQGREVIDFGTDSQNSMDYPDTIKLAARAVAKGLCERGVVLCGSGVGAAIVANKIHGIRAAFCPDDYTAEFSRRHNDANVLVLAGRRVEPEQAKKMLDIWLSTEYEGGRHQARLDKISEIESEECRGR